jgi:hypothetical protein
MLINRPWQQVFRNVPGEPTGVAADPTPAAPAATPAPEAPAAPAPAAEGPDLSWMPEDYRKDGTPDLDAFRTHYEDMAASLSALTDGAPQVPETPDAYQFAVPEDIDFGDIKAPDWFKFEVDAENPLWGEVRGWMHEMKMPAEASKGLVSMLAKYEAAKAAQADATARAEMESLGQGATARIDKIQRTIETRVRGEKQRNALLQALTSADAVRALEELISGPSSINTTATPPGANTEGLTGFRRLQAARGG